MNSVGEDLSFRDAQPDASSLDFVAMCITPVTHAAIEERAVTAGAGDRDGRVWRDLRRPLSGSGLRSALCAPMRTVRSHDL